MVRDTILCFYRRTDKITQFINVQFTLPMSLDKKKTLILQTIIFQLIRLHICFWKRTDKRFVTHAGNLTHFR